MKSAFAKYGVKSPEGNEFSDPYPFNLMFQTQIGPKQEANPTALQQGGINDGPGSSICYLRPETAQGIFVNFRRLLEQNQGRLPMGVAQLGLGFRNEIAPRNGLLRVREFQMAEIEHFVDPRDKTHPRFNEVKDLKLPLFSRERQLSDGKVTTHLTIGEAVEQNIINSETLGYFMGRSFQFFISCGIQQRGIRFRQHLSSEMAHYACDCWDTDIETSYGWIECAGHADRSAFDLTRHSKESRVDLVAFRKLPAPVVKQVIKVTPNKQLIGQTFKKNQQTVLNVLSELDETEKVNMKEKMGATNKFTINHNGENLDITKDMVSFESVEVKLIEEAFVPAVIEPSFGIGRIIFCILEHCFRTRGIEDQEERNFLSFPPRLAPVKCSVLSISAQDKFTPILHKLKLSLMTLGVSSKLDNATATIGKRYARTDEVGVPFGITVDFQTVEDMSVTLRERDTMKQIRLSIDEAPKLVSELVAGRREWSEVITKYPTFVQQELK
eukprot:GHVN01015349.1.p1 GENE.GHVN01015349.1~~GHVN01015349.1.p1  ORF type:complete len:497 (+),score=91.38 GHVN01015349.1:282-1772(+)